jgi:cold shock CspA family protein
MSNDDRRLGVVTKFFAGRGFGFIRPALKDFQGKVTTIHSRSCPDHFFHVKQAIRDGVPDIAENDIVLYDVGRDPQGRMAAINLKKIGNLNDQQNEAAA